MRVLIIITIIYAFCVSDVISKMENLSNIELKTSNKSEIKSFTKNMLQISSTPSTLDKFKETFKRIDSSFQNFTLKNTKKGQALIKRRKNLKKQLIKKKFKTEEAKNEVINKLNDVTKKIKLLRKSLRLKTNAKAKNTKRRSKKQKRLQDTKNKELKSDLLLDKPLKNLEKTDLSLQESKDIPSLLKISNEKPSSSKIFMNKSKEQISSTKNLNISTQKDLFAKLTPTYMTLKTELKNATAYHKLSTKASLKALPTLNYLASQRSAKALNVNKVTIIPTLYKEQNASELQKQTLCNDKRNGCSQICTNGKCTCYPGFELKYDNKTCIDINECKKDNGHCEHVCTNKKGYYLCSCLPGYVLKINRKSCIDQNECFLNNGHGPCQDRCVNTNGSYYCTCGRFNGTILSKNGKNCEDINECKQGTSGCSHNCFNTYGGVVCTCPIGMTLGKDSKTCEDIDECQSSEIRKKCQGSCLNIPGSYYCLNEKGTLKDEIPDDIVCPPLHPPVGYFQCNRENNAETKMKFISDRKLLLNRPGMKCFFSCKEKINNFTVLCGPDGKWIGGENVNINFCN